MILNKRKSNDEECDAVNDEGNVISRSIVNGSLFATLTFFFHASLQAISLTLVILNILIARDIHVVASMALSQFNDRTISKVRVESLGQLFKILHFCFDFSFISLGFSLKKSYKHCHSCMLLAGTNVCLNLPSEIFEYLFVNSFNYKSIRMVVSR